MTARTQTGPIDTAVVPDEPSADATPVTDDATDGNGVDQAEYAVLVAAYRDEATADTALECLAHVGSHGADIKSIVAMRSDACGVVHVKQLSDDSTRTGTKVGLLGGVAAGVLLPPPLLASVVALGLAGAAVGKIRYEYRKAAASAALLGTVGPSEAGLLAIVKSSDVDKANTALPAGATVRTTFIDRKTAEHLDQASRRIR